MSIREPGDVLIVGGGIAGVTTATSLREGGFHGGITLVEATPACTDHPPLSKRALVEGATRGELDLLTKERAAALNVEVVVGVEVVSVDASAHTVLLADGRVMTAEAIVVAVGAEPKHPVGYGDHPRVMTLRGYDDAMAIRAVAGAHSTVVVGGGGFIGAEAAASLRESGSRVVLVDPHEVPGSHVLGDTLARWLHAMHSEQGVEVRHTRIDAVVSDAHDDNAPMQVALGDGSTVAADLVVVGVGVTPRVMPGAERLVAPFGISIEASDHWDAARLDGMDAAALLLGTTPALRGTPWFWTDRYGHHIEVVGDLANAGLTGAAIDIIRAGTAVFRVDGDLLLGAASIDDPMTVRAARRIIDRGVRVDRDVLADPSVSLRRMLRG
ncbi:pyruvate/2-oxoglutarate dehydrogenase complex dihydrolipoamide dehydrogenase (E3) component [Microbacterium halimionae]|uniref:Pyruvate/2-oxoglutarate dehydrogenase complex dihydrolipoamide dehydrogenase (E3) component n=1 Tax=Microbacterium halimionae TaxID=1526413 RepID=A0A7W3JLZ7_9MICO|nr:FAD-dependent oxidoreductase [Microbacterium halimionae]MBA8815251.1 pyruvate/2-oxoglutarate dehydrogenase complex dihydrolipoamide dehydrogenase (E3) component [Microbacterium halimionae]NII93958.1 pyruvate/2-oxoglutarate dehydrogenase complex dihydrolipoamide dehydrogenase (E3) component [Microbacterium halimionae]